MNRQLKILICIIPVVVVAFAATGLQARGPVSPQVLWYKSLYTAHKQAKSLDKPMMIVFGADWCEYCKRLDTKTLADPRMAEYVNGAFIPVRLDLEKDQRIAKILEVERVPCTVILSPDADLLGRLIGYADVNVYYTHLQKARQVQNQVQQAEYHSHEQE